MGCSQTPGRSSLYGNGDWDYLGALQSSGTNFLLRIPRRVSEGLTSAVSMSSWKVSVSGEHGTGEFPQQRAGSRDWCKESKQPSCARRSPQVLHFGPNRDSSSAWTCRLCSQRAFSSGEKYLGFRQSTIDAHWPGRAPTAVGRAEACPSALLPGRIFHGMSWFQQSCRPCPASRSGFPWHELVPAILPAMPCSQVGFPMARAGFSNPASHATP